MENKVNLFELMSDKNVIPEEHLRNPQTGSGSSNLSRISEIALIGLGDWGKKVLLNTLQNKTHFGYIQHIHLVAGENFEEIDHHYGKNPRISVYRASDYLSVLNQSALTAVVVSTPCRTHYEIAKAALLAEKHVFVEKTFVLNQIHAEELIKLANQKALTLMVGYEYMYEDAFSTLRHLINGWEIGDVREIELYLFNKKKGDIPTHEKYGTSIVNHHATHLLSILQRLLGVHPIEDLRVLDAETSYVRFNMRYAGIVVTLATAVDLPNEHNYRTAIIRGAEQTVEFAFDGSEPIFTVKRSTDTALIPDTADDYPDRLRNDFSTPSVQRELEHFFECIVNAEPPISGGRAALHLVQMTDLIEDAYQTHKTQTEQLFIEQNHRLRHEVEEALKMLLHENEQHTENRTALMAFSQGTASAIEVTLSVVDYLSNKPYAPASEIAAHFSLSNTGLKIIYKLMQRVHEVRETFRRGVNYDYFDVADRFFDKNDYEVTFFVGLACPYKCTFCRMTMASQEEKEGYLGQGLIDGRSLRFSHKKADLLKYPEVVQVLEGLEEIRGAGRPITVKISGGLEPMTDPERVAFILEQGKERGFPVRIYSNGILIDTPDLRNLVLKADDLRISLNALNEAYFQEIYRAGTTKSKRINYEKIITVLKDLVAERKRLGSKTLIGINYVVVKENIYEMWKMAALCEDIGLDYVNYNTDYCDDFNAQIYLAIEHQMKKIKTMKTQGELNQVSVSFGGALLQNNVFAKQPVGHFDPKEMSQLKVFVDPGGEVTPVHEGTYPFRTPEGKTEQNPYVLGKLSEKTRLQDLLKNESPLAPIAFRYLAPFELILGLEMLREQQDHAEGFTAAHSPYRRRHAKAPLML